MLFTGDVAERHSKLAIQSIPCEWEGCDSNLNCWISYQKHLFCHCRELEDHVSKPKQVYCMVKKCAFRKHSSIKDLMEHTKNTHLSRTLVFCPVLGCHDQFWASRRDTLTNHVSSEHEDIYEKDVQVVKHLLRRSSIPFVFAHDKTLYTNKLPLSHNMPSSTNPAKTPPTSLGGLRDAIEIKRKATGQRLQGPSYIHSIASSSNSGMTRIQSTLRPLSSSGQDTRETTRTSRNTKASQIQNIVESDDDDSDDESQCGYMFSDLSKNSKTSDSVEDGTFDETLLLAFRRVRLGEDNLNRISRPVDVGQRVRENVWLRAKQDNIGWSAFTRRHIHMLGQGTDIDIDTYIKQGS